MHDGISGCCPLDANHTSSQQPKMSQTLLSVSGSRRTKLPLIENLCLYHAGIGKERMQTLVLDAHELEDICLW